MMNEQVREPIEFLQENLAAIDSQFEFWLTITFAVVVASFLARDQLSRALRVSVATLYLLAVVMLALRMAHHANVGFVLASTIKEISSVGANQSLSRPCQYSDRRNNLHQHRRIPGLADAPRCRR
jgi:hypothetical protein